ncbi:hypothetical protein Sjap_007716 [Stephania japonica]|uniref:Uncharacterized protein n=1 Tax=Stephania japonica TaxID=461633 RepID=A0AAP0PAP1_9MAGN
MSRVEDTNAFYLLRKMAAALTDEGPDSEETKQSTADMTVFVSSKPTSANAISVPSNVGIYCFKEYPFSSHFDFPLVIAFPPSIEYEMGSRIDELEQSINELRTEMGAEGSPSPLPSKSKPEDSKPEDGSA